MKNTSYFKNRNKEKKSAWKVIFIFLLAVLVIVPSILAIAGYYIKSNNLVGANSIKVSLFYDGTLIGEQSDDPQNENADELVFIFNSLINKIKKTDKLPDSLYDIKTFDVNISTRTNTYSYKCFFSTDADTDNYCVDSENTVYIIDDETSDAFLASPYAEVLYSNAGSPKMYSSSDEAILPYSHDWNYKNRSGVFQQALPLKRNDTTAEYNMSGSLGLTFDQYPDECSVKIYKSGIKVYDDDLNGLSSFLVEAGTNLQFDVIAKWNQNDDKDFYGTAKYNFKVLVRDRATFLLDKTSVNSGEAVLVSCTNVLDAAKIKFVSEPSIGCSPIFYSDHDIVRTLIPISNDLEEGEYKFTFYYGATTETLTLNVNKSDKPKDYTLKAENAPLLSNLINQSNTDKVIDIVRSIKLTDMIFAHSAFIDYKDSGAQTIAKYGTRITTANESISHVINGTQFAWNDNNNAIVQALNSGIVVKVDYCTYLGDFVIIDHGLGLITVYAHLDTVFAKEGDVVMTGEALGLCGALNIVSPSGVFVMCFIYDVPIDYDSIAGKPLPFYYSEIEEEE